MMMMMMIVLMMIMMIMIRQVELRLEGGCWHHAVRARLRGNAMVCTGEHNT
jgi:hypothetical protein